MNFLSQRSRGLQRPAARRRAGLACAALVCLCTGNTWASNGLDLTGYGTESSAMGGADVAVARDSLSINTNPAGMTQLPKHAFDFYVTPFYDWLGHSDNYGNDEYVSERFNAIFGAAYAQQLKNTPLTAGVGLFVQGGSGYDYKDLQTAFGNRDETSSLFTVVKLAPGLAWKVNERLSLGVNVGVVYAALKEALFANTSVLNTQDPAASFFGLALRSGRGFSYSDRIGMQYQISDALTVALTYAGKTPLPINNGTLTLNETAAGLGFVTYGHAQVKGLALPQEVAIGVAFRPASAWLLACDLKWLDWNGALRTLTVEASDPSVAGVAATQTLPSVLDFRDQLVVELGGAYQYDDKTILRAGFNYAHRPIPEQNLSPTFAIIQAPHYMIGLGRRVGPQWELSTAVEVQPPQNVGYTNPVQPFGANATEHNSGILLHLMVSRRW